MVSPVSEIRVLFSSSTGSRVDIPERILLLIKPQVSLEGCLIGTSYVKTINTRPALVNGGLTADLILGASFFYLLR